MWPYINHYTTLPALTPRWGVMCSETWTGLMFFVQTIQLEQCVPTTNFQTSTLPSHLKYVNVYIYLCPVMVSFIWKEVGSQDFKSVALHQPLHHITCINTQVGSYVLRNGDWPYVFCTNKPIRTVCPQRISKLQLCLPT